MAQAAWFGQPAFVGDSSQFPVGVGTHTTLSALGQRNRNVGIAADSGLEFSRQHMIRLYDPFDNESTSGLFAGSHFHHTVAAGRVTGKLNRNRLRFLLVIVHSSLRVSRPQIK